MRARRAWYARHPAMVRHLSRPVISLGNLSVGGTGKTPLVAALASRLVSIGERPAILSRGYGRRRSPRDPVVVSDGVRVRASVADSGDEPMLLAGLVPGAAVVVGASRYASGLLAEDTLGATFHVLDDGYQHVQLARDVNVLVTTPDEIGGGRVLPFGRLRECAAAAVHADVVVVVGSSAAAAAIEARRLGVARSCGATRVLGPAELVAARAGAVDPEQVRTERWPVVAVAGIAHPDRFFQGLDTQGWKVAYRVRFPDHHWYTARDVARIAAVAGDAGARLVLTTAKDAVKLEALGPLPCPLACVPLRLDVDPAASMDEWIAQARGPVPGVPVEGRR